MSDPSGWMYMYQASVLGGDEGRFAICLWAKDRNGYYHLISYQEPVYSSKQEAWGFNEEQRPTTWVIGEEEYDNLVAKGCIFAMTIGGVEFDSYFISEGLPTLTRLLIGGVIGIAGGYATSWVMAVLKIVKFSLLGIFLTTIGTLASTAISIYGIGQIPGAQPGDLLFFNRHGGFIFRNGGWIGYIPLPFAESGGKNQVR